MSMTSQHAWIKCSAVSNPHVVKEMMNIWFEGARGRSTDTMYVLTNIVTTDGACSVHLESHSELRAPHRPMLCHDTMCLPILA